MTTYTATIRHHSIAAARTIQIDGTLTAAKAAASREFGDEQRDYNIVIAEHADGLPHEIVARKRVSGRTWHDAR